MGEVLGGRGIRHIPSNKWTVFYIIIISKSLLIHFNCMMVIFIHALGADPPISVQPQHEGVVGSKFIFFFPTLSYRSLQKCFTTIHFYAFVRLLIYYQSSRAGLAKVAYDGAAVCVKSGSPWYLSLPCAPSLEELSSPPDIENCFTER